LALDPRADTRQIAEATLALRPGDIIFVSRAGRATKVVVVATAQRVNGTKLTVVGTSREVFQIQAGDFDTPPIRIGRAVLPEPYSPNSPKFIREAAQRVQRSKTNEHNRPVKRKNGTRHPIADDPDLRSRLTAAISADRIDSELAVMMQRIDKSVQSVSARFDELVLLMERRGYVSQWSLTDQGRILAKIFHELDLLVAEALSNGLFDGLNPAELASLMSTFVYEFRRAEDPPRPRIPKTLQQRWKSLTLLSKRIANDEASAGIARHRLPDPGLMEVSFDWTSGVELIDILNDDLTAGDFVRTMKQLIDLLRQVSLVAELPSTREVAQKATQAILRGVVAASHGSPVHL
ncbi:MAG: hypothetical protein HQ486_02405, partial [Acidimicrobiaceae bacterium]|nr:hypothetical protein [Acidimicrobiaceae bacterium]